MTCAENRCGVKYLWLDFTTTILKYPPDYSFNRNGKSLAEYLWLLVDNSKNKSSKAANNLRAMEWGVPSVKTDWEAMTKFPDTVGQQKRFETEVKRVFASQEFEGKRYIEALGGCLEAEPNFRFTIFDILSEELLVAPRLIESMLDRRVVRFAVLKALERTGTAAMRFAPRLLQDIDTLPILKNLGTLTDTARALGSIGRGNPEVLKGIIKRLHSEDEIIRTAAVEVICFLGSELCGREREICKILDGLQKENWNWDSRILALASAGRDLPDIRRKILEYAETSPLPKYDNGRSRIDGIDKETARCGEAIHAIAYFVDYADECIPVLIRCAATFEEFDSDECYNGSMGRISDTLKAFGASAAPSIPMLVSHLGDDPDVFPRAIVEALAAMGEAGKPALPALRALGEKPQWYEEDLEGRIKTEPIEYSEDLLGWAIQQIRGIPCSESEKSRFL